MYGTVINRVLRAPFFSMPSPCPPGSEFVPGVQLFVKCGEEWNWPSYLTVP